MCAHVHGQHIATATVFEPPASLRASHDVITYLLTETPQLFTMVLLLYGVSLRARRVIRRRYVAAALHSFQNATALHHGPSQSTWGTPCVYGV